MKTYFKFTDEDINQLKVAEEALHSIECARVPCDICPLYIENRCIANRVSNLRADAEKGVHIW